MQGGNGLCWSFISWKLWTPWSSFLIETL
jgi:hypothetical protein